MNIKMIGNIAIVSSEEILIKNVQSTLDFITSMRYEKNCDKIALNKKAITEDFFILSTGLAGEILQKIVNYRIKLAIYGDFMKYTSKPLKDFIYEANSGKDIFFVNNEEQAIEKLKN